FSSRRRHTRFSRDWSSDVCSSDLLKHRLGHGVLKRLVAWGERGFRRNLGQLEAVQRRKHQGLMRKLAATPSAKQFDLDAETDWQIGRASCRERGESAEVGGKGKKG